MSAIERWLPAIMLGMVLAFAFGVHQCGERLTASLERIEQGR